MNIQEKNKFVDSVYKDVWEFLINGKYKKEGFLIPDGSSINRELNIEKRGDVLDFTVTRRTPLELGQRDSDTLSPESCSDTFVTTDSYTTCWINAGEDVIRAHISNAIEYRNLNMRVYDLDKEAMDRLSSITGEFSQEEKEIISCCTLGELSEYVSPKDMTYVLRGLQLPFDIDSVVYIPENEPGDCYMMVKEINPFAVIVDGKERNIELSDDYITMGLSFSDIGKRLFLSKEEADAVLNKEEQEPNEKEDI